MKQRDHALKLSALKWIMTGIYLPQKKDVKELRKVFYFIIIIKAGSEARGNAK